ncbi:hypothetical protein OG866_43580 [Streptomyces sp. NBC_00663]|uniref:hypothetical protein n=1 Tax=Streptomyces sp. NBC_00663 TaxID=2975801 RepID=UPI002E364530|nr:hypothetical protein [Streptomyces sp. NBC_00663]
MAAALGYHAADRERGPRLSFHLKPGSHDTTSLIGVLDELANLAGDHLADVADAAERGIHRVCSSEHHHHHPHRMRHVGKYSLRAHLTARHLILALPLALVLVTARTRRV